MIHRLAKPAWSATRDLGQLRADIARAAQPFEANDLQADLHGCRLDAAPPAAGNPRPPEGSKRVRQLLEHYGRRLKLQYLPGYSPACMPMELLWNDWHDQVTHNRDRTEFKRLERDSDNYFARCARAPQKVLRTLGSPFAGR